MSDGKSRDLDHLNSAQKQIDRWTLYYLTPIEKEIELLKTVPPQKQSWLKFSKPLPNERRFQEWMEQKLQGKATLRWISTLEIGIVLA
jgi:hypothetical protein